MTEKEIKETVDPIARAIREAGLDPYDQLYGYLETGNLIYITRRNNAREQIAKLDKQVIRQYLNCLSRETGN